MQKPRKPNRGSERKSWAPNHYITDEGTRFPVSALNDAASKTGVARTTLALLKAGAKVPRAYLVSLTMPQRPIDRTPWRPGCYISSTGKATPITQSASALYPITRLLARTLMRVMHPQYQPPIQHRP